MARINRRNARPAGPTDEQRAEALHRARRTMAVGWVSRWTPPFTAEQLERMDPVELRAALDKHPIAAEVETNVREDLEVAEGARPFRSFWERQPMVVRR